MKLNHEISLICCILIIIATEIQCSLRWDGVRFNSTTFMRFPKEAELTLGSGSKPNYFPIIEYREDYDPHPVLKCTAYVRAHDRCNFTLHVRKGTEQVLITRAYQFSDTKLAVALIEREFSKPLDSHVRITTIDLNTCSSVDILNSKALGIVQFYPDSFDLLAITDGLGRNLSRTSFDVNGNQIGKSTLPVSTDFFQFYPASTKSPSQGSFISTFDIRNSTLSLVYSSGKEIKRLVNIGNQIRPRNLISYADDSSRAICWVNRLDYNVSQLCECAQFDQLGNELWKNRTQCDAEYPFGVRNLKGGGVVLLSHNSWKGELHIAEMRPRQETLKSTVKVRDGPLRWDEDLVKVMDFNEVDRTLFLYWQVSPYSNVTYTDLAFAKLSFPNKAHK